MDSFEVWIPALPISTNCAYKIRRSRMYISAEGKHWAEKAALIIGAKHGRNPQEWRNKELRVSLVFFDNHPLCWDVDGRIKITLDTLASKLGFDDRYIMELDAKKQKGPEGVLIRLEEYNVEEKI